MKTIGLLGGMSWESSAAYYKAINQGVKDACGGLHSAKIILYSVDFSAIEEMQRAGDWQGAAGILADAAKRLEAAGADFLLICTNTMHKVAPEIQAAIRIPLLHIADATAQALTAAGVNTVGLLGTRFTMEQDFYKTRLAECHGLTVLTPNAMDREVVHTIIYHELCLGKILPASKQQFLRAIDSLTKQGAEGVILGCTEIGLLVSQADTSAILFDTAALHAEAAVRTALAP